MSALPAALRDPRAAPYRKIENDRNLINSALLEAVGTTPMKLGREIPVDRKFLRAFFREPSPV